MPTALTSTIPAQRSAEPIAGEQPSDEDSRKVARGATMIPTGVAALLFLWGSSTPTLWGDELATWDTVRQSWDKLLEDVTYRDAAVFPYYVFMYAWTRVFGESEFALRLPSILAMTAAVAVTSLLASRLFGRSTGLAAGLVMAFIPSISRIAQETRMYAFVVALAVVATYLLVRAIDVTEPVRGEKAAVWVRVGWWSLYTLAAAALGLAHVVALALLAGHAAGLAVRMLRLRRWSNALPLWWLPTAVVAFLPIAWVASEGLRQRGPVGSTRAPMWIDLENFPASMFGSALLAGLVVALAVVAFTRLSEPLLFLGACAVVPLLLLVGVAGPGTLTVWHPRYLLFVVPFFAILAGQAVRSVRWPALTALVLVVGVFAGALHLKIRQPQGHAGYDARALAAVFKAPAPDGQAVMFTGGEVWHLRNAFEYYVPAAHRPVDALASGNLLQGRDRTDVEPALRAVNQVYLVRVGYPGDPLENLEPGKADVLRERFRLVAVHRQGKLSFFLFQR